jgi:hypothetical protein
MPAFAVLYSLKCRSLPDPSSPLRLVEPPICNGELRWLEGQTHNLAAEPAAAMAKEFFLGR